MLLQHLVGGGELPELVGEGAADPSLVAAPAGLGVGLEQHERPVGPGAVRPAEDGQGLLPTREGRFPSRRVPLPRAVGLQRQRLDGPADRAAATPEEPGGSGVAS